MIDLIAANGFPGYYEITGYSKYAVSQCGNVINKITGKTLSGSRNPDGYHNFRLTGDCGVTLTWGRHRLLGFVFKHPGIDVGNMVINHEDGVKGNDILGNLEWTTYQGNAEHAGANNLTSKCIPISVRDVDTGLVTKFPSVIEYARNHGLTKDAVLWRIRIGEGRVFPERKQYRVGHSDAPWHVPTRNDEKHGRSRKVVVRNVKSDIMSEFDKLSDVANVMGVKLPTLSTWINNPEQPVVHGFVQLQWLDELTDWRIVEDPQSELDKTTGNKSVVVVNEETGERVIYDSASNCAKAMGILKTTLHNRLKSDGQRVIDGYRFCYYSKSI